MSGASIDQLLRRSCRKRNSRTALQLLGIESKRIEKTSNNKCCAVNEMSIACLPMSENEVKDVSTQMSGQQITISVCHDRNLDAQPLGIVLVVEASTGTSVTSVTSSTCNTAPNLNKNETIDTVNVAGVKQIITKGQLHTFDIKVCDTGCDTCVLPTTFAEKKCGPSSGLSISDKVTHEAPVENEFDVGEDTEQLFTEVNSNAINALSGRKHQTEGQTEGQLLPVKQMGNFEDEGGVTPIFEARIIDVLEDTDSLYAPVTSDDLNNLVRNQSGRAVPVRHVVVSDELQRIVDRILPTDNIDDHVIYQDRHDGGKKRSMFCKYCSTPISHRHQFRRHIKSHPEVDYRPYCCPLCDYKAQIKAQIARHINIHGAMKPYMCTECGRGFNFKQKLQTHMKYHSDIRDQMCPLCGISFHEFKTLKSHIKNVHKIPNSSEFLRQSFSKTCVESKSSSMHLEPKYLAGRLKISGGNEILNESSTGDGSFLLTTDASITVDQNPVSFLEQSVSAEDEVCKERSNSRQLRTPISSGVGSISAVSPLEELLDSQKKASVHSKRLYVRKKCTIYGTCKTKIQTEIYKRGLSSDAAVPNNWRKKPFSIVDCNTDHKRKSSSRILDAVEAYCSVVTHCPENPEKEVYFACKFCSAEDGRMVNAYPSKSHLAFHLENSHPDLKAWHCDQCSYCCRLRTSMIVHMKNRHQENDKHMCEFCGEIFVWKQKLMRHIREHLNQHSMFKCCFCSKVFDKQSHLSKHINRIHSDDKPYVCHVCKKSFKEEALFRRHLETHNAINTFRCATCKKVYKSKMSLVQHNKSHSCVFRCDVCNKEFGSYSGFMGHKMMHVESHSGYQCEQCPKLLHTKGSLNRHCKIVHGSERPFTCKRCPKTFKTKKDLQSHELVHVPDKRFECATCSYQCKRFESLRVHMRVHFTVKPYCCILCQRQYTQKKPLETHIKRHISKLTYCSTCDIHLGTGLDVLTHLREVHHHPVSGEVSPLQQWHAVQLRPANIKLVDRQPSRIVSDAPVVTAIFNDAGIVAAEMSESAIGIQSELRHLLDEKSDTVIVTGMMNADVGLDNGTSDPRRQVGFDGVSGITAGTSLSTARLIPEDRVYEIQNCVKRREVESTSYVGTDRALDTSAGYSLANDELGCELVIVEISE